VATQEKPSLRKSAFQRGIPHTEIQAERRNLLDRDTMSGCYSSQEYHADEKLLDSAIESGYVCATSSRFEGLREVQMRRWFSASLVRQIQHVRLASLRASDTVPAPTAILSTSLRKYRVLWRVEGFNLEQQESAFLRALVFGGGPACTDRKRALRLPGFLNCKYDLPVAVDTRAISLGIAMTLAWIFWRWMRCSHRLRCHRGSFPLSTQRNTPIPNTIGPGFCINLQAEKTPPSSREC
jgi:hypothetical protein